MVEIPDAGPAASATSLRLVHRDWQVQVQVGATVTPVSDPGRSLPQAGPPACVTIPGDLTADHHTGTHDGQGGDRHGDRDCGGQAAGPGCLGQNQQQT